MTAREAVARGHISLGRAAAEQIRSGRVAKGDPLQAARLAGIMAAKRTGELIPLCHPLPISHAEVTLLRVDDGYDIEARVRTAARTGVEMEALTAVSRGGPHDLRHAQGGGQADGHRRHPPDGEARRPVRGMAAVKVDRDTGY